MQLSHSLLVSFLAFADLVVSAPSSFSLYAYGNELVAGMRLFYADGYAYVGDSAPSFASQATNVTFSLTDDSRFVAYPIDNVTWTSNPSMCIGAGEGDLKTVGFASNYKNVSDGVIVTGFGLFGGYAYNSKAGSIEMYFVASPTNETGIYQIKWDASLSETSESIMPISLRTAAPATPSG
ncbi:hypothetical protein BU25DRAFT_66377 [Macroventuria anomochaeta]|uniref:Uncharacterized protein n=1 Tax=Macroventuria anomochaeta TaxID=301207 RepID=A0ACB6RZ41_9PLEO|nr:uncharacterized protein BU25DRAFT_66377 [Macroventuria anomochaeta]KAF2626987.1 hypothetical protein BU25DRAFT_66377 [Macroventuria anomochaeta]